MLEILVAGGYDSEAPDASDVESFCTFLGERIIERGYKLLNGCMTELDRIVAEAAYNKSVAQGDSDPDSKVISYVVTNERPIHDCGTILRSRLTKWDLQRESLYIPEPIRLADVVILIGGWKGTFRAANFARIANKPILPFTAFGGAAQQIYAEEMRRFEEVHAGRVDRFEYEKLNEVSSNWKQRAIDVVSLAEKVASSNEVFVIMSFAKRPDLEDLYESFQVVCQEAGYKCQRVDDSNAEERILPAILDSIRRSAFVIADLTESKPNVYYELGFAEGLGKAIIVTAKSGTVLPFDVKDIPTVFWESQKKLKERLKNRIKIIARTQGRSLQTT
jgi:nucleoside 2-deoxyribosyltransferase